MKSQTEMPIPVPEQPTSQRQSLRKKILRVVMISYFLCVVAVCIIAAIQIVPQVLLSAKPVASNTERIGCPEGIHRLYHAIDHARKQVHFSSLAETEAVELYRASLEPAWSHREQIKQACKGDSERMRTVDTILRLGYAEQDAVRRDAAQLGAHRKRTEELVRGH